MADTAVITKMVRVMMLAPFLMILSVMASRRSAQRAETEPARGFSIPWFAVAFVGVVIFNTTGVLAPRSLAAADVLDTVLLAMAMSALGLTTTISAVRAAGAKPLWLGATLFAWLMIGGGAINFIVGTWFE